MCVPYLEKRADGADMSVLCFRLAVFLPVDTQVFFLHFAVKIDIYKMDE